MKKTAKEMILSNLFPIMAMLVGLMTVFMGFGLLDMSGSYIRNSMAFGGDFYTEIYYVVESIRGSLNSINNHIVYGFGRLMICVGLTDICAFGCVLAKNNANNMKEAKIAEAENCPLDVTAE